MKIKKSNLFEHTIFIMLTFMLAFIVSMRGDTPDTFVYANFFENYSYYSYNPFKFYKETQADSIIQYFSFLIHLFSDNYRLLFFLFSVLTFIFIKRICDILKISFLQCILIYIGTYFLSQQFMQIRQGLATPIVIYCLLSTQARNKVTLLNFFFIILSVLTHIASVVVNIFNVKIIRSFLYTNKINDYFKLIFIFIIVFLSCRVVMMLGIGNFGDKMLSYKDSQFNYSRDFWDPVTIKTFIILAITFFHRRFFKDNSSFYLLMWMYLIGFSLRLGFYDFALLSGRLATYFTFTEIFLIPLIFNIYKTPYRIVFYVFYSALILYINLFYNLNFLVEDYFTPLTI
ncbi:EpsG family protein [Pectobacterium fontis]|nr:EpsG family protein [Pectobacterium fontis]